MRMSASMQGPEALAEYEKKQARMQLSKNSSDIHERVEYRGKIYDEEECVGPIIMGQCKGNVIDSGAYHPTCHGEWLNGQCTGPLF